MGAFVHGAWLPPNRNFVEFSVEGGFHYRGPVAGRDKDALGLGIAFLKISDRAASAVRRANQQDQISNSVPNFEATIELVYRYQAAPWLSIQPHAQYVTSPAARRTTATPSFSACEQTSSFNPHFNPHGRSRTPSARATGGSRFMVAGKLATDNPARSDPVVGVEAQAARSPA